MLRTTTSLAVAGLALAGCRAAGTTTTTTDSTAAADKRRREIESGVDRALENLYHTAKGSRELASKASGALVFPSVIAAGLVVGGQYGEGALRVQNRTAGYYSLASVSAGLQVGAQSKSVIFLFMTQDSLNKFRSSRGWTVGVDATVALMKVGANGELDITSANGPVLAFVLTNAGLMAGVSLEGTKINTLSL
jgi:lipid-binding SYLF domain-containing protein